MCKRVNTNSRKSGTVRTTRSKSTTTGTYSRRPPHTPPKGTGTSNKGKK